MSRFNPFPRAPARDPDAGYFREFSKSFARAFDIIADETFQTLKVLHNTPPVVDDGVTDDDTVLQQALAAREAKRAKRHAQKQRQRDEDDDSRATELPAQEPAAAVKASTSRSSLSQRDRRFITDTKYITLATPKLTESDIRAPRHPRFDFKGLATMVDWTPVQFTNSTSNIETKPYNAKTRAKLPPLMSVALHDIPYNRAVKPNDLKIGKNDIIGEGSYGTIVRLSADHVGKYTVLMFDEQSSPSYVLQTPGVLMDEAIGLLRLKHPNIIHLVRSFLCYKDTNDKNGPPTARSYAAFHVLEAMDMDLLRYGHLIGSLAMPYRDLASRVMELDCLEALAYMHGHGYTHRDIKPGNILVGRAPGRSPIDIVAKLGDFGSVTNHTSPTVTGTFQYFAPECVAPRIQLPSSDVWAVYASMWEFRFNIPMLAIYNIDPPDNAAYSDDPTINEEVSRTRWTALLKNEEQLFIHIAKALCSIFGQAHNPVDNYSLYGKLNHMNALYAARGNPSWARLYNYHRDHYQVKPSAAFKAMLALVMKVNVSDRLSARDLLNDKMGQIYWRDIKPWTSNSTAPAVPYDGIKLHGSKSLWYVDRDETGTADAFESRAVMGLQIVKQDNLPILTGPVEYVLHKDVAIRPRRYKPPRTVTERDLLATGYNYHLFKWEPGKLLYTVTVPVDHTNVTFITTAKQFCLDMIQMAAETDAVIPVREYFMEVVGQQCVVTFVLDEPAMRHMGAVEHLDNEAWTRFMTGISRIGIAMANKHMIVNGNTLLASIWINTSTLEYRLNLMHMFKTYIGTYTLRQCLSGAIKSGIASQTVTGLLTPALAWAVSTRVHTGQMTDAAHWNTLLSKDSSWETVKTAVNYKETTTATMAAAKYSPSIFSPRVATRNIDTII